MRFKGVEIEDQSKSEGIIKRAFVCQRDKIREVETKDIIAKACPEGHELTVTFISTFVVVTSTDSELFATPNPLSRNANLAGFQCIEFTSGSEATPVSPIEPPRASGAISKKGTAVVIVIS